MPEANHTISRKQSSAAFFKRLDYDLRAIRLRLAAIFFGLMQYIRKFSIRLKLNLILISMVLVVTLIMSIFVLQHERKLLLDRHKLLCQLSLTNLSNSIAGHLLDNDRAEILEAIFRIENLNFSGLASARVILRNGESIPPNSGISYPNQSKPASDLTWLNQLTVMELKTTDREFQYYYPVRVMRQGTPVQLAAIEFRFIKAQVLRPIAEAQQVILLVTILIILLSFIGIYFLSDKLVLQIRQLSIGAKRVAGGNLNVQVPVTSTDELGELSLEFNAMVQGLREKLQMQKFVSKSTMQMIKQYSHDSELPRNGNKSFISVLFSDVRDFSSTAEAYPPEEVVQLVNIYLDLQACLIEQHNGIVDKFVGDQVMGVFEGQQQEMNALNASVAIQKTIRELNRKRASQGKVTLEVGIGLNNGYAVHGNIGSHERMDYTVVGSTVNLGSHLCNKAKPRQILIPVNFAQKVKAPFITRKMDPITIKGRKIPVSVFEIPYS
ncbi:adenylate/guanylate cyclase domain-containing protein [bacterium]|nr:adenylate/guanylate cyclase domain-containing protein [bacterium]